MTRVPSPASGSAARVPSKRWVAVSLFIAACASDNPPAKPSDDGLAIAPAIDRNPAPDVVEIDLEARPGEKAYGGAPATPVWTYNGTIPGPLIDAKVGDRLVVHFKNSLPEPTTIHWHGIRLPATMDGSLAVQEPIPPGAQFEYAFTLKDAGLYWFHPHIRSDIQVQKGLYGLIRVRGASEPAADLETVLALDDIRLAPDGTINEYLDDTAKMMGREGKTLLVNGVADARLKVAPGALVRLRLVNVANGRFFNLRLAGHRFRVIGTDGGLLPRPYDVETLLLSPGERYDVMIVVDGAPGTELALTTEPYERGHGSGSAAPSKVMTVVLTTEPRRSGGELPVSFPDIERLPPRPTDFPLEFDEMLHGEDVVFTINGKAHPEVPLISIPNGEVRVLDVINKSEMDHPFHLHGFFFQVLERGGVVEPAERLANKDTIIVPAKSNLRLAARFDEPGTWMYHCHILEHGEHGMMGEIEVK